MRVPDQYLSIQSAVDAAGNGDTILVSSGRYYENVFVNKSVSIIGDSPSTTSVIGIEESPPINSQGEGNVFEVAADNVLIANLTIKNAAGFRYGVHVVGAANCVISNNVISNEDAGIQAESCTNISIFENTFTAIGSICIRFASVTGGTISENVIENNYLSYCIILDRINDILIDGNDISNPDNGIILTNSANNTLSNNKLTININQAIKIEKSPNTVLVNNEVTDGWRGISISEAPGSLLRNNKITNSTYAFGVFGYNLDDFALDIDTTNTANGKPIYYITNQENFNVNPTTYPKVGYLALINCRNATVQGMTLTNNLYGLLLAHTTDSLITHNTFRENGDTIFMVNQSNSNTVTFNDIQQYSTGIRVYESSDATIIGNNLSVGTNSIWLEHSSGNTIIGNNMTHNSQTLHLLDTTNDAIYNNNFISNSISVGNFTANGWNITYPSGGNYWGSFNGADFHMGVSQGQLGSDGIIDEAYIHWDFYPLAAPIQIFDAGTTNGNPVYVELESNSTLSNVEVSANTISFTASGAEGTVGFCRITIPNRVIQDNWENNYTVVLNGEPQSFTNWTDSQNTYVYVSYQHPNSNVAVIPEFPVATALAVIAVVTLTAVAAKKRVHRN
ncbi:MAG: right-handed parallel beta-helix repeat-containing protein [Candidatus Bathyarchaeota archaeon]|nr:right-handed parallel beta-helix repeat-containing protein [Candidatus Bathyarchaeota archaeon]